MKTIVVLAIVAASLCRGDVISQVVSFELDILDSTRLNLNPETLVRTLTFDQFDPRLGELTGVQYLLTNSTATRTLTVTGSRNSGTVNSASLGTVTGSASLLGVPLLPVFLNTITASCSGNPSCTATNSATSNPTVAVDLSALRSAYIGMSTITAALTLTAGRTLPVGTPLFAAGLSRSANIDANWKGDLTLTYLFTPVPEPATWGFLAMAGVGLAFSRRVIRRRL